MAGGQNGSEPSGRLCGFTDPQRRSDDDPTLVGCGVGEDLGAVVQRFADRRVVITNGRRLLGHRTADGKVLWTRPIRWHQDATFTVVDDRLLVADQSRVTAYRMGEGTVDWTAPAPKLPDLAASAASAASGGFLYAHVQEEPALAVIDLRRGGITSRSST
ncbi:hypothetical protein E1287_17380 [Actinomadura sp. KC06]|uniref:outer membrane protein assembly factor BamB family protein n=1 Tax=Actinomadura sp. KC06 TaxID=2530369 RepID=UPI0010475FA4|nr:PQQ-binding-like beta-propeller repeat protein [Actinomadura sp. KC06]TDD34255.1 hypothetical protein E1287_17380 [Actinomadura sp. KC06]